MTRWQGFWIAMLLITSTMTLLTLTIAQGEFEAAKDLAGIFSGWIAAIVGFYFLHGQTHRVLSEVRSRDYEGMLQGIAALTDKVEDIEATILGKIDVLDDDVPESDVSQGAKDGDSQ